MNSKYNKLSVLAALSFLAAIFTVALTYATLELPILLGHWLSKYFPDIHPVIEPDRVEDFVSRARPIGYACLGIIIILIVLGFVVKKRSLSILGSIAFFLPTFGYFFAAMFFLAGLGILRVPFIPLWDPAFNLMNLGDISYLPYMVLVYPFWLVGVDIRVWIAWAAIMLGLLLFFLGTVAWFYGKIRKTATVDFWIYKYSRHPQYLGFIIWSYGIMLLAAQTPVPRGGENPGASLSWLLTTLVIICIARSEEISMKKKDGTGYLKYKSSAPFMFPVPGFISMVVTAPMRFILKKREPETGKELIITFLVYAAAFILLSLPFTLLHWPSYPGWSAWPTYAIFR